jgi:hypothetical protein
MEQQQRTMVVIRTMVVRERRKRAIDKRRVHSLEVAQQEFPQYHLEAFLRVIQLNILEKWLSGRAIVPSPRHVAKCTSQKTVEAEIFGHDLFHYAAQPHPSQQEETRVFSHLQEASQVSHALHQLQNGAVAIRIGLQMRTNELKRVETCAKGNHSEAGQERKLPDTENKERRLPSRPFTVSFAP